MGLGALLALLVLFVFGKTPKTDGLFTAYAVYGVLLMLAQSLRTTIVARLVEAPSLWAAFDHYLGAVLALALAAAVPLVVLADPLAHLLTGACGRRRTRRGAHRAVAVRARGGRAAAGRRSAPPRWGRWTASSP